MRKQLAAVIAATLILPLAACGGEGDVALAERAEEAAEANAEAMEAAGANETVTDRIEDAGEARADAIDDADPDVDEMTSDQQNAMVSGNAM